MRLKGNNEDEGRVPGRNIVTMKIGAERRRRHRSSSRAVTTSSSPRIMSPNTCRSCPRTPVGHVPEHLSAMSPDTRRPCPRMPPVADRQHARQKSMRPVSVNADVITAARVNACAPSRRHIRIGNEAFVFCLVVHRDAGGNALRSRPAGQTAPQREPATIMVVEDEVLIRLVLADELRMAGFFVLEAADADEAMALIVAEPAIALLFTDVRMPGSMDGLELMRRVRVRWPHLKIIVASGAALPVNEEPCWDASLQKPYDVPDVLRSVGLALGDLAYGGPHAGTWLSAAGVGPGALATPAPAEVVAAPVLTVTPVPVVSEPVAAMLTSTPDAVAPAAGAGPAQVVPLVVAAAAVANGAIGKDAGADARTAPSARAPDEPPSPAPGAA